MLMPVLAQAANGPKWSPSDLASFADVIVTGRVASVASGWDAEVNAIYTYVTLDVIEVLKSDILDTRITIKQLGGVAGGVGLSISDQATFRVGEEVLLYLEARPRDATLYTIALWQGKWAIRQDARGQQIAVREPPRGHAGADERQFLGQARQSAAAVHDRRVMVETRPTEAPARAEASGDSASARFNLLGPFRYLHSPHVDVQTEGQPGLPGGGLTELLSAMNRWNSAGSTFRYIPGHGNSSPRCSAQLLQNGRVTVSFMDPCGEMSNTGGTLALGGSYFLPGGGGTSNGQQFDRAVEGFVINNDSPIALQYLRAPGCFEDIQTHELGHVLGLNHSNDPGALMFATIERSSCMTAARGLRADDIEGVRFIYGVGGGSAPPQTAPTNLRVVSGTSALTVAWSAVADTSADPSVIGYRLDFRAGHHDGGPVVASLTTAGTTLTVAVPPGVSGAFNVMATAVNAAGAGPPTARVDFTIPSATGSCTTPPAAVPGMTGMVSGEYASVQWNAVGGATSYHLQAGSTQGADDLLPLIDLGPQPGAAAAVPAGFTAWLRVYAVNQCGRSQPVDFFLR